MKRSSLLFRLVVGVLALRTASAPDDGACSLSVASNANWLRRWQPREG